MFLISSGASKMYVWASMLDGNQPGLMAAALIMQSLEFMEIGATYLVLFGALVSFSIGAVPSVV